MSILVGQIFGLFDTKAGSGETPMTEAYSPEHGEYPDAKPLRRIKKTETDVTY